jgi:hypothetical protein
MEQITSLEIAFIGKIVIPEQLANVKIKKLILSGEIEEAEIKRIRVLFPDSELIINRKSIAIFSSDDRTRSTQFDNEKLNHIITRLK